MNEVILEDRDCPLGCKRDDKLILTGTDRLNNLPGTFSVVKCRNCGLMRTNPRPDPQSMAYYYPEDYGPYVGTKIRSKDRVSKTFFKARLKKMARKIFDFKTTSLPPLRPGRLLEIGCASGAFLHKMSQEGWQVEGIEFSKSAAREAAKLGYTVYVGQVEGIKGSKDPFDLIVGWMVLEHLHGPVLALKKLRGWIKSEGWLVLSVPNAGSLEFRIFRDKWYALQLPSHLFHFTPSTVEKILNAGGWEIKKIHHQRMLTNTMASLGYILQDLKMEKIAQQLIHMPETACLSNYILYPLALFLSLFGQTGRMTIWARPKP